MTKSHVAKVLVLALLAFPGFAGVSEFKCPEGIGSHAGEAPKIALHNLNGRSLFVCGYEDTDKEKPTGRRHFSEFDVYTRDKHGSLSKSIFRVGALKDYWISSSKNGLHFEELTWIDRKFIVTFAFDMACSKDKCFRTKELCRFKNPKAEPNNSLNLIRPYLKGTKRGKVPDETLIDDVSTMAYIGNVEAQNFFLKEQSALALDAHPAETYHSHRELLNRLKKAKCL
jgi:hypothetical protein